MITNKERKVFVGYAREIMWKLLQVHKDASDKALSYGTWKVLMDMALPDDNPNYKARKQYMPDSYNKTLFTNGNENTYQSLWMSLKDKQHDTVVRQAIALIVR